ncbi:MAG: hypothetical protein UT39_C0022G0012 [Candidatus Woesebacteria bacterium GW2011_GWA1_39_21]|uniref:Uncharacterized protein n=1 Tax=Candidatus Woesebacteria bacterium GW2011_GWA1_39_21 TaxID=1618550 RepID=A0A0G0N447_9BACT|nr:MAG: hypothetical protein UT39_C0022G0012 [Candidatus Woesebacteria bacterium GW2011_GWA1_39_21]
MSVMRKVTAILSLFVLLTLPSTVYAEGNTVKTSVTTKIQERIEAREEQLQQIRDRLEARVQTRTATREARLNQLKQNLIKKYYSNMSQRLWATISRLETLIQRIDARVMILEDSSDLDLTSQKSDVVKAESLLSDTKALLTSSDGMIESVVTSNNPKDAYSILRSNISDIKNNLKQIHLLLVKVLGDLAGLRVGTQAVTPTVTPSAT